jgi:hypothetical protein
VHEICLIMMGAQVYACRSDGDVRRRPRVERLSVAERQRLSGFDGERLRSPRRAACESLTGGRAGDRERPLVRLLGGCGARGGLSVRARREHAGDRERPLVRL